MRMHSLTRNVPGALAIGFLAAKILGEQQESPTVTSRSIVHQTPIGRRTDTFGIFPYLVKNASELAGD